MKFESQILAGLFIVCFAICAMVMGAMLKTSPSSVQLAATSQAAAAVSVISAG